ncbi:hypothetical protein PoB_005780400 [Plakobranchus ocellatus]|uniref:Uncharacterized protein n=1 Tax=Plakobranchus ocellatus TaxID=259542 RepID=A0AAV4CJI3_9GAST|nr:hypothetical protein PoB_005780400 [Plakobranchus ocellatus]
MKKDVLKSKAFGFLYIACLQQGDLKLQLLRQARAPVAELELGQVCYRLCHEYLVHNKVISGFQALRQARAPVAGLEPATEGSLQISGQTRKPLCYRRLTPFDTDQISGDTETA